MTIQGRSCPPRDGRFWGGPTGGVDARWGPYGIFREPAGTWGSGIQSSALSNSQFRLVRFGFNTQDPSTRRPGEVLRRTEQRLIGVYETMYEAKLAAARACRPSARRKR